jgi:hypothetical protein
MMKLERGLQGQRRGADATGRRHEGVNLRLGIFLATRTFERAHTGAHQVGGGQRLDQEVRDLQLNQDAHRCGVEFLRHHQDRHAAFQAAHDALQRLDLVQLRRIHIDDDGAEIGLLHLAADFGDVLLHGRKLDDFRGGEGRARILQEGLIGRDEQDFSGLGAVGHGRAPLSRRNPATPPARRRPH